MCQDKEDKHIQVDRIVVSKSDQHAYRERHEEYMSWDNQRANPCQNMMSLFGLVKQHKMFNLDAMAGYLSEYYFFTFETTRLQEDMRTVHF
jgi:hypothetical protein